MKFLALVLLSTLSSLSYGNYIDDVIVECVNKKDDTRLLRVVDGKATIKTQSFSEPDQTLEVLLNEASISLDNSEIILQGIVIGEKSFLSPITIDVNLPEEMVMVEEGNNFWFLYCDKSLIQNVI